MECEPETSHAVVAMIQPPITPLQKMVEAGVCAASRPNWAIACKMLCGSAGVSAISEANSSAPKTFEGRTMHQSRSVFHNWRFSARTSATG